MVAGRSGSDAIATMEQPAECSVARADNGIARTPKDASGAVNNARRPELDPVESPAASGLG